MGLSKISIWRGEMDMQKSIKSLKRNGILLLAYDLLVLCIVFVKNGMINMSAEAATSLIVSIGFGIFINLLWIVDSKTWITDYGKRKCIWSYWCGEIVLLLLVVALENMNQLVATSAGHACTYATFPTSTTWSRPFRRNTSVFRFSCGRP